jgi:ubiquinone/menaquinone biosynthesis C-methylase UbiE
MESNSKSVYICPVCCGSFSLTNEVTNGNEITAGEFVCTNGHTFAIADGVPDFTWPKDLAITDEKTRQTYDKLADEYDKYADIPFMNFFTDPADIREKVANQLNINEDSKVLEIGAGDGRGATHVAKRLGKNGRYFLQELSPSFLKKSFVRLKEYTDIVEYSIANASYLSFPDNYFDAAFHFGGFSTFSEPERCLSEMARVVKPGGRVIIGDESMAPWLRNTEMGKIMANSNPNYNFEIPFSAIPVIARDVKVEWIMLGGFFLLEFTVGEGEPMGNYHIPIPSEKGGTYWTRYYGKLEGVSDEVKKLAHAARQKSGKSMHDWLEEAIKEAAKKYTED